MPTNRCIRRFRPLSTRALRALELRDLNPIYTSWSACNYYLRASVSIYGLLAPVIPQCHGNRHGVFHICKISWLVQGYTHETGCESIYTILWLCLNAYSYSFTYSQTAIFSTGLWIEDHSSAESLEALPLHKHVWQSWQQKVWRLFGCCRASMLQQPWQEHLNCLGGIRAPLDIKGKRLFLFSIARTKSSTCSRPIAIDNGV